MDEKVLSIADGCCFAVGLFAQEVPGEGFGGGEECHYCLSSFDVAL